MGRRPPVRRRSMLPIFLLFLGTIGVVGFGAMIAIDMVASMDDEAYYTSLTGSFVPRIDWDAYDEEDYEDDEFDGYEVFHIPVDLAQERTSRAARLGARAMFVDFNQVRQNVPGARAWIRIDGTILDYPVMQGADNEFYLTRRPDGVPSRRGSIFIDYRNAPDFTDHNTLIHGHRMRSGAMFGMLSNYSSQSFYDRHLTVSIFTPQGDYELVLFAGYAIDQTVEGVPIRFRDVETFYSYIEHARRRSMFRSDVEVSFGDRLVTLATCEYTFSDGRGRLLIVGKLVEKDY